MTLLFTHTGIHSHWHSLCMLHWIMCIQLYWIDAAVLVGSAGKQRHTPHQSCPRKDSGGDWPNAADGEAECTGNSHYR